MTTKEGLSSFTMNTKCDEGNAKVINEWEIFQPLILKCLIFKRHKRSSAKKLKLLIVAAEFFFVIVSACWQRKITVNEKKTHTKKFNKASHFNNQSKREGVTLEDYFYVFLPFLHTRKFSFQPTLFVYRFFAEFA